jgi:hypothetical protein
MRAHDCKAAAYGGCGIERILTITTWAQVVHFSIPQVVQCEGCYSGGRVTVTALPQELLGPENLHTWPLRRLDGLVSDAELQEHVARELTKVCGAVLQTDTMKMSSSHSSCHQWMPSCAIACFQ